MSARPCGCDPEAGHICAVCTQERLDVRLADAGLTREEVVAILPDRLDRHLNEVINVSWNYAGRCRTPADHTHNAVLGLVGEAGECADIIKKYHFHAIRGREGEYTEKLKYEMGDVIFYWLKLAELFGFSIDEILAMNRAKLESRHPEFGKVEERFGKDAIL